MSYPVIGLDRGTCAVKAVILERSFRGYEVKGVRSLPVPQDGSGPPSEEAIQAVVEALVQEFNPDQVGYVVAASGADVSAQMISLPFTDQRRIEQTLPFELENYVPFDLDDMVLDYEVIDTTGDEARVVAGLAPKSLVSSQLERLQKLRIDPQAMVLDGYALAWAAPGKEKATRPVAIIDLGHTQTLITVKLQDGPDFIRTLKVGGLHITQALMAAFGVSYRTAERMKAAMGPVEPEREDGSSADSGEAPASDLLQAGSSALTDSSALLESTAGGTSEALASERVTSEALSSEALSSEALSSEALSSVVSTGAPARSGEETGEFASHATLYEPIPPIQEGEGESVVRDSGLSTLPPGFQGQDDDSRVMLEEVTGGDDTWTGLLRRSVAEAHLSLEDSLDEDREAPPIRPVPGLSPDQIEFDGPELMELTPVRGDERDLGDLPVQVQAVRTTGSRASSKAWAELESVPTAPIQRMPSESMAAVSDAVGLSQGHAQGHAGGQSGSQAGALAERSEPFVAHSMPTQEVSETFSSRPEGYSEVSSSQESGPSESFGAESTESQAYSAEAPLAPVPGGEDSVLLDQRADSAAGDITSEAVRVVVDDALLPILREIRSALMAYEASEKKDIGAILLVGGGAELQGIADTVSTYLGVPAGKPVCLGPEQVTLGEADQARYALPFALSYLGAANGRHAMLDFRQGEFRYRRTYENARNWMLSALALLCVGLISLAVIFLEKVNTLTEAGDKLQTQLGEAVKEGFPTLQVDFSKGADKALALILEEQVKLQDRGKVLGLGSAHRRALDVLKELSTTAPTKEEVAFELDEFQLEGDTLKLRGTTGSFDDVDKLEKTLAGSAQVKEIKNDVKSKDDKKLFTFTITLKGEDEPAS